MLGALDRHLLYVFCLLLQRPECSNHLLVSSEDIAVRWLRFLTNISQCVLSEVITEASLPTNYKAASPETMYSFLYGSANKTQLADALLGRKTAEGEEINQLASKLYRNINLRLLASPSQP